MGDYDEDIDGGSDYEDKYVNNRKTKDNISILNKSNGNGDLDTDSDNHVQPERKKKIKRRRKFTDEEKEAIIEGVNKFGTQWNLIRKEYKTILSSRTGVNIKDCYRNLTKHKCTH